MSQVRGRSDRGVTLSNYCFRTTFLLRWGVESGFCLTMQIQLSRRAGQVSLPRTFPESVEGHHTCKPRKRVTRMRKFGMAVQHACMHACIFVLAVQKHIRQANVVPQSQ